MRRSPHYGVKANKKAVDKLVAANWTFDGLWWINPRSKMRYNLQTAVDIEDLRADPIKI